MSAVIQNEYTGNNSTTTYSFTFPYLKTSDIKASLDGVETTAFTLPNATTLQFNTAPSQDAKIKIFRQTSVDNLTATFYAGSAIKSEDLNDNFTQNLYKTQEIGGRFISALGGTMTGDLNMGEATKIVFEGATDDAHETTLTVADPTADRTITFPNVTGNVVTTGDTGTVATGMIANDAINGTKIADDSINSEHYVDGSIDTQHIANAQVTTAKIADDAITGDKIAAKTITNAYIADDTITSALMANNAIATAYIEDDAITNAKIADNSIDSEHYVDGSIDAAHIASNAITNVKMADDSVGTAELQDSSVDNARLADNAVTLAKMADNSVGTSEIVDAAVTTAKIAADAITGAKIADDQINSEHYVDGSIDTAHIADSQVTTAKIADGAVATAKLADSGVTTAKIASDAVTTVKIVNNAITSAKIADDAVGSTELGDGVIDTVHVGAAQITTAKIADSNITTAKITDANVTTAKIANDAITIGKLGCEQTTISDSDSHIPTSGAVVDYVAAQIAPLGGLEVIANEDSFPTTQPSAGVVISINDIEGLITNGSGVATNARTTGNGSDNVTINGFPSSLYSKTMAAGLGLMVSSTGSSQTYTYHKLLAKEADVEQLSNDINDFASRYRVGSSNPTSSLDNGDLFFNTGTGKMLVYNGTNTAWEEVQSIGNFFISTFSEAFDGSRTQFTLSNAPTNVQQVILSLNGVIQKPGTAFTLSGSTVTLASAPASGTDYFAVVMGSTVNIGTPSNNTVSTAVLQDDSVTTAKIAASNVTATELGANAVITSKIADDAVTAAKLASNAVVNASVDASAAIAGTKISPDFGSQAIATTGSATIGTDLIHAGDTDTKISFTTDQVAVSTGGTSRLTISDSAIQHSLNTTVAGSLTMSATNSDFAVNNAAGSNVFTVNSSSGNVTTSGTVDGVDIAAFKTSFDNLSTDIVSDTSPQLGGNLASNGNDILMADNDSIKLGASTDFIMFHDNAGHTYLQDQGNGALRIRSDSEVAIQKWDGTTNENMAKFIPDGAVELFFNNHKSFQTSTHGAQFFAPEGGTCQVYLYADEGDDNADLWGLWASHSSSKFSLINYASGSYEDSIVAHGDGAVELYYDNEKQFETISTGFKSIASGNRRITIGSTDASGAMLVLDGDSNGDGSGNDYAFIQHNTDGELMLENYKSAAIRFATAGTDRFKIDASGHFLPATNDTYNIGSTSNRVANVYTNDLHLSNEGHTNDVDGTWGSWTIQEGESDLFLKNNRSGKKYKFNLTEVS